jgi:hypothetical protein
VEDTAEVLGVQDTRSGKDDCSSAQNYGCTVLNRDPAAVLASDMESEHFETLDVIEMRSVDAIRMWRRT